MRSPSRTHVAARSRADEPDLVIRNGILDTSGEPVEVGIADGHIVAIEPEGLPDGAQVLDAGGGMISRPLSITLSP